MPTLFKSMPVSVVVAASWCAGAAYCDGEMSSTQGTGATIPSSSFAMIIEFNEHNRIQTSQGRFRQEFPATPNEAISEARTTQQQG